MYGSFLGISEALHMDIFQQPLISRVFDSFNGISVPLPLRVVRTVHVVQDMFQGFLEYWSIGVLLVIELYEL
jgi:hypothetical protein